MKTKKHGPIVISWTDDEWERLQEVFQNPDLKGRKAKWQGRHKKPLGRKSKI